MTSLGLMAHHLFGCWHGDYRLKRKYGDAFEAVKSRTSTLPFAAILEGRQQLPKDYYKARLVLECWCWLWRWCCGHGGGVAACSRCFETALPQRQAAGPRFVCWLHLPFDCCPFLLCVPLQEFLRGPYLLLLPFCVGTYLAHPLMQRASYFLGW